MNVYIVTAGSYSGYHIDSAWSTEAKASERADLLNRGGSYGQEAQVETYNIDPDLSEEHIVHTLFTTIDGTTGAVIPSRRGGGKTYGEVSSEPYGVTVAQDRNRDIDELEHWKITIKEPTEDRCHKVLSEVLAQTKARIDSTGPLPQEVAPKTLRANLATWIFHVWRGWGMRSYVYSRDGEMEPYRIAPDGTPRTWWQKDGYVEPTINSSSYTIHITATS